jgi:hypothetical protein
MSKYRVRVRYEFTVDYAFDGPETAAEANKIVSKLTEGTIPEITEALKECSGDFLISAVGKDLIIRIKRED